MGWLYMTSLKGHSSPRQYLDAQFTYERVDVRSNVLPSLAKMRSITPPSFTQATLRIRSSHE